MDDLHYELRQLRNSMQASDGNDDDTYNALVAIESLIIIIAPTIEVSQPGLIGALRTAINNIGTRRGLL